MPKRLLALVFGFAFSVLAAYLSQTASDAIALRLVLKTLSDRDVHPY